MWTGSVEPFGDCAHRSSADRRSGMLKTRNNRTVIASQNWRRPGKVGRCFMDSAEIMLTTEELALRWKMTNNGLRVWRISGKGPAFVKLGRDVRYRLSDVEAYEKANTVQSVYTPEERAC
jgi:hypothetical protein